MTTYQGIDFYQLGDKEMTIVGQENDGNQEARMLHIRLACREAHLRRIHERNTGIHIVKDVWTDERGIVHRIQRYATPQEAMERTKARLG